MTPLRHPLPGTCEYVTLLNKRDFADVINDSETNIWNYLGGPDVITKVLIRKRAEGARVREDAWSEGRAIS